ncbi:DNA cytosine methyltransferase [Aureimonas phyllosphaerae]|uniref:Cytosine-specific methyltransferase n=1 Tax=Aureimonas phyllosphaerae TaxID=1166078 RepID=A0A7W6BSQ4_9HYPH|nr:DNA (cytosine-5-)-methyltransferase [Aureimonas phyllosphaerae]MBB3937328.1 DNA-cytosine methyltransferase [Aureimonas phyllosphaerae]MBB3961335.1 DNA-cytosine methyltransferase [Aureimonas phyllosphaerae]SFF42025.1 DNA-methyltransferase (dcm) [Aureimonas phyllosphaerae]
MVTKSIEEKLAEDRRVAKRLRKLKDTVGSLGKRGLEDIFVAGEALEEAAALLRGGFSGWVRNECGIDPRTALNFRKTFRVLGDRKDWLIEKGVAPSVAVTLASAPPKSRERALAEIEAGRRLTAADAKLLVRVSTELSATPLSDLKPLGRAARAYCTHVVGEARRIVVLASEAGEMDGAALHELAVAARGLRPLVAVLDGEDSEASLRDFFAALAAVASAEDPDGIRSAAADLVRTAAFAPPIQSVDTRPEAAPFVVRGRERAASTRSGTRMVSSAFKHGLTAFELCAGGGGQAAGLAKAGFRHVGLLEREKAPCETLRAAFGEEHVIEASLVGYEPGDVGPVDLLAGGVPCQPFSQAGRQNGEHDDRDLFPEALRLVKRLRPRAVMLENVRGIMFSVNDGYRARILSELSRMGYRWDWWELNCADFGVPQRRNRAILVAFREPEAWARFRRLKSVDNFAEEPVTMAVALESYLRSRGFDPTPELLERMQRVAPTVIGGSLQKQSSDLGQEKTRKEWIKMGFVGKRWGVAAPGHEHVGDVMPTNEMMALLQTFPPGWPFRGKPRDVNRQIANAFPTPVAFRLGLAVAEALTGETFDPIDQVCHEAMRWNHVANARARSSAPVRDASPSAVPSEGSRSTIPLAKLRAASSIGMPEGTGDVGEDHDIDYDLLGLRFGPWPKDLWEHQRKHGLLGRSAPDQPLNWT